MTRGCGGDVRVEGAPCQVGLLDQHLGRLPLKLQRSSVSWSTDWCVKIGQPRTFDLTGEHLEAWYVGIFDERGEPIFVLPIVGPPVTTGTLTIE